MTAGPASRRWYQFTLRRLLLVTALLALMLVPVVWVTRERQQLLRARNEALRAVILAERHRAALQEREAAARSKLGPADSPGDKRPASAPLAGASALIERLRRENAELKESIEQLRRRVERLEARTRSGSIPARE